MRALDLTLDARADLWAVLANSQIRFGPVARRRYRLLLEAAFADLQSDPDRPGVTSDLSLPPGLRLYPVRFSRTRIPAPDRVRQPRHVIAFKADRSWLPSSACWTSAWTCRRD